MTDTCAQIRVTPDERRLLNEAIEANGGPPTGRQTYVYFLQAGPGLPIKIGRANDPLARREGLQCGSWMRLHIVGLRIVSDQRGEVDLHQLFADYRVAGEWFRAHPALVAIGGGEADPELIDVPLTCPADKPAIWWPGEAFPHLERLPDTGEEPTTRDYHREHAALVDAEREGAPPPFKQEPTYVDHPHELLTYRPRPDEIGWRDFDQAHEAA